MTAFTSFAFAATGGSATRTDPDRWADQINVKDYGAKGDGSTDDTTAIQAAVTAAFAAGLAGQQGSRNGVVIFVPPGVYKTTAPITFAAGNASIRLVGSGRACSIIYGSYAGYVIDKPSNPANAGGNANVVDDATNTQQNLEVIRGLGVKNNNNSTTSGAIRFNGAEKGIIEDCLIQGFTGVDACVNTFCTRITNCDITSPFTAGTSGTVGAYVSQVGVYQCRFQGWDSAIVVQNAGFVSSGNAVEVCNYGHRIGRARDMSGSSVQAFSITGFQTEGVGNAVELYSCSGGFVGGCTITGVAGEAPGSTNCQRGFQIRNATDVVFAGNAITATLDIAGVDLTFSGGTSGTNNVFIGLNTSWIMPSSTSKSAFKYVGCSGTSFNPTMAFADLPGSGGGVQQPTAIEGMEFDITDSNTAAWGATAAGSGSNHVKVRYNGASWTVVGK